MTRSTLTIPRLAVVLTSLLAVASYAAPAAAQARERSAPPRHGSYRAGPPARAAVVHRAVTPARAPGRVVVRSSRGPYAVRGPAVATSYRTAVPRYVSRTYVSRPSVSRTFVSRPHGGTIYAQRRHGGGVYRGRSYRPSARYYPHYPRRTFVSLGYGWGYPYGYWANPFYGSMFYPSWYGPWGGWGGYPGPHGPYGYGRWNEYAEDQGGIRLQVNPKKATVYVDGYFVGEVNDFDGSSQRLALDAGVHKIEVRAPGFETLAIDVNILRQETIRYRGALRPTNP